MFTSLKQFIELRLGYGLTTDELIHENGYFLKTTYQYLDPLISFLKSDPDLRLNALDTIFVAPQPWGLFTQGNDESHISIVYQFKSLKLPYRVSLVLQINHATETIISISRHFAGASWLEADISKKYNLVIDDNRSSNFL